MTLADCRGTGLPHDADPTEAEVASSRVDLEQVRREIDRLTVTDDPDLWRVADLMRLMLDEIEATREGY